MPTRTGKSARHAGTGRALRPTQRQAGDRRNRRLQTMLVQGRYVFRRSPRVAAAIVRGVKRVSQDEPTEPH